MWVLIWLLKMICGGKMRHGKNSVLGRMARRKKALDTLLKVNEPNKRQLTEIEILEQRIKHV